MSYNIDFAVASSEQIEKALCQRLKHIRLARNTTQSQLAAEAGVSPRTIRRLEKGEGISMDTFIRVLTALGLQRRLQSVLPDPAIRPIERTSARRRERQRARPGSSKSEATAWTWGDAKGTDE